MTGKEVTAAPAVKRFELRCQEHGWRDESYRPAARQLHGPGGANSHGVPAIAEPKDVLARGHDIQHAAANDPSAHGCIRTSVLLETCLPQLTFERVISGKRYDFDDNIDISRGTHGRSGGIRNE